jgi:DNA-binding transcriptional regulator YdaS (Cro superfamily)
MTVDEIISAAGSVGKLARLTNVSHSSVCDWRRASRIPVERALKIHEELSIPLHEIRPDVWAEPREVA